LCRGRKSIAVDLKNPDGVETVLKLIDKADALIEGFRPGVMERLGLGPDVCAARNPKLVFGRMTGWGQHGPMAHAAGHDINYISLTGALGAIGPHGEKPVPPLNLVGDFGGGGMLLALGLVAALLETASSGKGQVVDAAMVDGASVLATSLHGGLASGSWSPEHASNMLDTGSHYYDAYETADGKWISLGSIEPQFYAEMLELTGLKEALAGEQHDRDAWPERKAMVTACIKSKTRAEWETIMEGSDVCFAPVLEPSEAPEHPHAKHRNAFAEVAGVVQPAPAPRFSRTESAIQGPPSHAGQHSADLLTEAGFSAEEAESLTSSGAVR
jgi:alpha-methylacyl-CoA racemase